MSGPTQPKGMLAVAVLFAGTGLILAQQAWVAGLVIKRISLQPLAANETLEYTQHGVTYRPTLRSIGRVQVEFLPQPGTDQQQRSTTYLVGVKDGVYFLLTAEPQGL